MAGDQEFKLHEDTKGSPSILDLPDLIMVNIFSRLPINSIFQCKCVCKVWHKSISDPYFAKTYQANPPFQSILISSDDVLSCLLELNSEYNYSVYPNKPIYLRNKFNLPEEPTKGLMVIGSCNGLICLFTGFRRDDHNLYISNLILRECVLIPKPSMTRVRNSEYGFGYSPASNQFKILRIVKKKYSGHPIKSEAEIFTIGVDKSWRDVGACPFPRCLGICGITFRGALHWIEDSDLSDDDFHLYSFNLAEEKVHELPLPTTVINALIGRLGIKVGVLGDCLCIFNNHSEHHLDIWWMRDYRIGESWTRDRIVRRSISPNLGIGMLHPITVWRDGEILIVSCYGGGIFSYDPKQKKSTPTEVPYSIDRAILYVPSFFSLKALLGEDVQLIDVTSRS